MPTSRKDDPPVDPTTADDPTADAPAADAGDKVTLAVAYPHDEFVPFGKDDPDHVVITAAGTPVPAGRVDAIQAAAKAADVTVREVK